MSIPARKKKILTVSAAAASLAVAAGFALRGHSQAAEYKQLLENSYTHAYYELTTAMSELDAALQKSQYATTPVMLEVLCTDVYGKAVAAQMALGELPAAGAVLEQTAAFVARVGDYACSLSKSTAAGGDNAEAYDTLHGLAQTAESLASSLLDIQSDLAGGSVSVEELIRAQEVLDQSMGDGGADPGGTTFQSMEADFPETPTLIYDGPFSEHLGGKEPAALAGLAEIGRDEARAAAADFLGLRPEILTLTSEGEGVLPTWGFSAAVDGGELYIEVTRQGGKVLSLFSSRAVGEADLSTQEALTVARAFLEERGFSDMKESYHTNQGNVLTINYAPSADGVICYPDLVKVSVALDLGTVVGFESHGWIMNHTRRELSAPKADKAAAQAVVSPHLKVLSHQLALIPTGGEYEVLCHEFKCRTEEDTHVIVYVNAATGGEEQILLLLEEESGTLVW